MTNYPPGTTGNEPEIAGWPECPKCGSDDLVDTRSGWKCMDCGHEGESDNPEDHADDLRDRRDGF